MQLERRTTDRLDQLKALVASIEEVSLKTIERFHANLHALLLGVGGEHLEVFHHERKFLLLLFGIHRVCLAHHTVHRADQRRATQHHHVVDERLTIFHGLALILGAPTEITTGTHTGADRAANQTVFIQCSLYLSRIDMFRRLNRNLDGLETPFLELRKQARGLGGKG